MKALALALIVTLVLVPALILIAVGFALGRWTAPGRGTPVSAPTQAPGMPVQPTTPLEAGGYVRPVPGGRVVRVAECGAAEVIVPRRSWQH